MLKGLGVLGLALFIEGAFIASITGPAAPPVRSRVVVGELAFAEPPADADPYAALDAPARVQGRHAVR
jgi:hypothetical protein